MSLVGSEENKKIIDFPYEVPEHVNKIYELFRNEEIEMYLVGGCVRDMVMGKTPNDFDFVTPILPEEMIRILKKNDVEYDDQYINIVNYVIANSEGDKIDLMTYKGGSLLEDLSDRDFTFNCMAYDIENQAIIDYFGGIDDIKNSIVRLVRMPRIDDDVALPFRAIRFALEFSYKIDEVTYKEISDYISTIDEVRPSTVRKNLEKIFDHCKPSLSSI